MINRKILLGILTIYIISNITNICFAVEIPSALYAIDNRQHLRIKSTEMAIPVVIEAKNNKIDKILDISRGGMAVIHNKQLVIDDIIPITLKYKDLSISVDTKVVSTNETRAGLEFINLDKNLANQLLYLSIVLEADNNLLCTRLK